MVIGARGCGKTLVLAIAYALYAILNPGHNWLHVAPTIDQARMPFDILLSQGAQGNFNRIFLEHQRSAPAPDIILRPWNQYDPGTKFHFRSIGGHSGAPMELLRSSNAALLSADEAFRVFSSDYYVSILAGMARGPNRYLLNKEEKLRKEYQERIELIQSEPDALVKKGLKEDLERWTAETGLSLKQMLTLVGNAGHHPVWWSRLRWGRNHPDKRWSKVWISEQNLYFTEQQRELLKQQFIGDPQGLRTELYADRPPATGDVFNDADIDQMFDEELNQIALESMEFEDGWTYVKHEEWGLVEYAEPPRKNTAYAAGTDPGTGQIPHRNSWVIIACDLKGPPFRITGLWCGNMRFSERGSLRPWIQAMKTMMHTYDFPEGHVGAEATGPQKGVHEFAWAEQLEVIPVVMHNKSFLIMCAQKMLGAGMFISPVFEIWDSQMRQYEYKDGPKSDQDFVMAFLALVSILWPYVAHYFDVEDLEEGEETWEMQDFPRDARLIGREVRIR